MTQKMIDEMMSNPNLIEKYAGNKRKLKRDIKKKQKKNPIDESIIQESYAKQYLKIVIRILNIVPKHIPMELSILNKQSV